MQSRERRSVSIRMLTEADGDNRKSTSEDIFNTNGKLLTPKKNSLIGVGKNTYYVSPKGTAISGWQIIGKKLYSVKKSGAVRKNVKYKGITFTKTGAAKIVRIRR